MIFFSGPMLGLLRERLAALGLRLGAWLGRVRASLAALIGTTIGEAAESAIRAVLGPRQPQPAPPYFESPWDEEDNWTGELPQRHYSAEGLQERWDDQPEPQRRFTPGWLKTLRTLLTWLHQQPSQRPLLTALVLVAGAGVAALVVGPLLGWLTLTVAALALSAGARELLAQLLGLSH